MSNDINLYYNKRSQGRDSQKILKRLQIAAIASLTIILLCSLTIAALKLTSKEKSLRDEESQLLQALKTEEKKIASLFLISERLRGINDLVDKRFNFDSVLSHFFDQIPSDVSISSFAIDRGNFSIGLSSNSLYAIDQSFDQFVKLINSNKKFKKIDLEELNVDYNSGIYSVSLKAETL